MEGRIEWGWGGGEGLWVGRVGEGEGKDVWSLLLKKLIALKLNYKVNCIYLSIYTRTFIHSFIHSCFFSSFILSFFLLFIKR